MSFRFLALALLGALVAVARAQSFNLDLDVGSPPEGGGGAPSSSFGAAAGQTGFWNAIDAPGPFVPTSIRSLQGTVTPVTFEVTSDIGWAMAVNFAPNTGDFAALLNDFSGIGASGSSTYTLKNLNSGDYVVYSYAVHPSLASRPVEVDVAGSVEGSMLVNGPMPGNAFQLGITHSIHHVHLGGSTLQITLSSDDNNPAVNGFQIIAVPEPLSCTALGIGSVLMLRLRRQKRFQKQF